MYDLSDIETRDVTLVEAQDFEDSDIHDNLDDVDHIEITDSKPQDQYEAIREVFDKITGAPKQNAYKHPETVEDDSGFENDYQTEIHNEIKSNVLRRNRSQVDSKTDKKHRIADVSNYRRPIIGVLTEPLRGDMEKKDKSMFETIYQISEDKSYIPKAHV